MHDTRPLALVTGASSGIGYELARLAAENGHDLIIAADEPGIVEAAQAFKGLGAEVQHLQVDLAGREGVDRLVELVGGRPLAVIMANAGHGLGRAFLDQDFDEAMHVIDTNITGTIYLLHRLLPGLRDRGEGRVLITGSIAGFIPGSFAAVYNGTKAFIDNFSFAIRNELKDSGVSITCLMPGPTETEFFHRAGLDDTKVGQARKDDPADVARTGWEAMLRGDGDVIHGLKNKVQVAVGQVTPKSISAEQHRGMAEPGSGER